MGADDGGNKPHPTAAKNPQPPCDDVGPGRSGWIHSPNQPGSEPAAYAVTGKILLAAAGALAGVLLALVAMYLYNSAARRRRLAGTSVVRRRRLDRSPAIAAGTSGDDRTDGTPSPRGLDPAVLRLLPVVAAGTGAGDCAVCLAEVEPGEKARALPRCAHVFHADCIDAWFRGNATCPLCRADVVAPDAEEAVAVPKVRIDVAPAMGRLPSGTDLDKTRRAVFASTRSVSF